MFLVPKRVHHVRETVHHVHPNWERTGKGRPGFQKTINELQKQREIIEKQMKGLKNTGGHENAHGFVWDNEPARIKFVGLKKRLMEIEEEMVAA